jgi:hypothetical protein
MRDKVMESGLSTDDLTKSTARISYTLGGNLEFTLTGSANIDGAGNALNNGIP